MSWKTIAHVDAVGEEEPLALRLDGREIAVFKVAGCVYAIDNVCTHQHALLTDGFVDGEYVECPLHQGRFHIPTGAAMGGFVTAPVRTYACRVEGDDVLVDLAAPGVAA